MRTKLPYSEYTVKELIFPYIRISYSDRINTLVNTTGRAERGPSGAVAIRKFIHMYTYAERGQMKI
jgi:hypothetical protein